MKYCGYCKQTRPFEAFNKRNRGYQSRCRECQRAYEKDYYSQHRTSMLAIRRERDRRGRLALREWMNRIKRAPCADCGQSYHPFVMDFDHVRGEKLFEISVMCRERRTRDEITQEIAKCDLVCANCHRMRTYIRKQNF